MTEPASSPAGPASPSPEHGASADGAGTSRRERRLLWPAAALLALAGTLLVYEAGVGLNWGIWTTLAAGGLLALLRRAGRSLTADVVVPCAMAAVLAWSAAFTTSGFLHFLLFVSISTLLALAVLVAAGLPMRLVGAVRLAFAPAVAAAFAIVESIRRHGEAIGLLRGDAAPVVRGVLMAIPILIVLALLLSGADPIFAAYTSAIGRALASLDFLDRVVVFGVFGMVALGSYGVALRGQPHLAVPGIDWMVPPIVGSTERLIILGSVVALFTVFVVLQVAWLFGDPAAVVGSGVTYAEHARKGFGELTLAATLCAGLLVVLERWKAPGMREMLVRGLSLTVIVQLHVLLASALRRVHLYEAAYGHTTDRLYARIYMFAVSAALILLAWELMRGLDVRRLARRCAIVAIACLLGLTLWNHEAWVARRNIAYAAVGGELDADYLGRGLSLNAAPTLVGALPDIAAEPRAQLLAHLHEQAHREAQRPAPRWFEWNARRAEARSALASLPAPQVIPAEIRAAR